MPRPYPAEFRARAIALVRAGKPQKQAADDLGIHPVTLSKWIKQDDIDRGERPGVPTGESSDSWVRTSPAQKDASMGACQAVACSCLNTDRQT